MKKCGRYTMISVRGYSHENLEYQTDDQHLVISTPRDIKILPGEREFINTGLELIIPFNCTAILEGIKRPRSTVRARRLTYLPGLQKINLEIENLTPKTVRFERGEAMATVQFLYRGLLQTLRNMREWGGEHPTTTHLRKEEEGKEAIARLDQENANYEDLRTKLYIKEIRGRTASTDKEENTTEMDQKRKRETEIERRGEVPRSPERRRSKRIRSKPPKVGFSRVGLINRLLKDLQGLPQRNVETATREGLAADRLSEDYQRRDPYGTPLEAENAIAAGVMGLPCITRAQ